MRSVSPFCIDYHRVRSDFTILSIPHHSVYCDKFYHNSITINGCVNDTLADLMGHKDTRMTRRYAHISQVHLANAIGLLEKSYIEFSTILAQSNEKGLTKMGAFGNKIYHIKASYSLCIFMYIIHDVLNNTA